MIAKNYIFGRKYGADFLPGLVKYFPLNSSGINIIGNESPSLQTIPTYLTGKVGNAASFNGTSQYFRYNASEDMNMTNGTNDVPFSVSFWANPSNSVPNQEMRIIDHAPFATIGGQWVIQKLGGNTQEFRFRTFSKSNTGGSHYLDCRVVYTPNTMQHFAFTYNGLGATQGVNSVKGYLNGTEVGFKQIANSYTGMRNFASFWSIGRRPDQSFSYFRGELDELAIWKNRELTATEVLELYNKGNAGTPII